VTRGPGRPAFPKGTAKAVVFTLRLTVAEREALESEARRLGRPVTQWARDVLLASAGVPSAMPALP
jgi:hypothetical protein